MPNRPQRGADVYGKWLSDKLASEATRKASIEQRGLAVISASGVLVSILVGLAAFLLRPDESTTLHWSSRLCIVMAAALLVSSAAFGLAANIPRDYGDLGAVDLDRIISESSWEGDADEAAFLMGQQVATELKTSLVLNNKKANHVTVAILALVAGITSMAVAILLALLKQ